MPPTTSYTTLALVVEALSGSEEPDQSVSQFI